MFADAFEWSLVSITGAYDFAKFKIKETEFVEITGKDYVYNIAPTGNDVKAKVFKLDISQIDRHVLMKQFTIDISYIFLDDKDNQLFTTKYNFDVSKNSYVFKFYVIIIVLSSVAILPTRDSLAIQISWSLSCRLTNYNFVQLQIQASSKHVIN
jgi:hypothetical protein